MKFLGYVYFTSIVGMYKIHIILVFCWCILKNNRENIKVQSNTLGQRFRFCVNIFTNNAYICTPLNPYFCQGMGYNFCFKHFLIWWNFDIKSDQKGQAVCNCKIDDTGFFQKPIFKLAGTCVPRISREPIEVQ